jgi:hypothetical protein
MALPSWHLFPCDGRRSQRVGPSPTLGSLGPSHHRCHKSRVLLRGPPFAYGVLGILYGEVRDMKSNMSVYLCPQIINFGTIHVLYFILVDAIATIRKNCQDSSSGNERCFIFILARGKSRTVILIINYTYICVSLILIWPLFCNKILFIANE